MGQKVHPIGIRLGVVKRHNANWYADPKQYAEYLLKDLQVREFLTKKLKNAMVSNKRRRHREITTRINIYYGCSCASKHQRN